MASATFTVNAAAVTGAVAVSASSTVNLALASTTGVNTVVWSIEGNHSSAASDPTITPAGSPSGATASFTMPAGAAQAYIVQCVINGGKDASGQTVSEYTARAVVGVNDASGRVPFAAGETTERSATHGWAEQYNSVQNAAASAAGALSVASLTVTGATILNTLALDNGTTFTREATGNHNAATTITADSYTTSGTTPDTFFVTVLCMGAETGGGGNFVLRRSRKFNRNGGTLAALDATETIGTDKNDYATVAVDIDASGDDIRIRFTGEAALTIYYSAKWSVDYHVGTNP